jgi:hypothetical protein
MRRTSEGDARISAIGRGMSTSLSTARLVNRTVAMEKIG